MQAIFSMFWTSSLPIRVIKSCGIEALSNLAPHLKQLHMLALWRRLCSRLWSEFGFLILWYKTVITNIFGEIKVALNNMYFT